MICTMGSFLSSTIVTVAVPALAAHFGLSQDRVQWVSAGFMVAMIPALSITPWLLARFGLRRTCEAAIVLLMAGGVIGGFSGSFELLVAMRALEGIAAGILQPLPNIVIMRAFPANEQGRAMGIYGLGVVFAPASGPVVGGFLVEQFGWRSILFVVVPFCLAALWLTRRYLPLVSALAEASKPLDWKGLALVSASSVVFLNALAGLKAADSATPWVLLALGVCGFAAFVAYCTRAAEPLLKMGLFLHRPFAVGALVSFLFGVVIFGSTYLMPVFFQMALDYTPSRAGFVILPAGVMLALSISASGRLADRYPAPPLVVAGIALILLSMLLLAFVTPASAFAAVIAWAALGRIGMGVTFPALTIGCVRGLASRDLSMAFSMNNFIRQLGGAVGVSAAGALIDWRLEAHSGGAVAAFRDCFLVLAALCMPALVAAWYLKERAPK
ncbi:MAG: DHA2 family efflux MFS transporter permease subunit [Burkholderiales bacterium]|nr:DHA2 family efflux MFS transporter permease subunit [Burkholderiales bacterium]